LKAVGYSDTKVCVIALGEALALYLAGALVGLALAAAVAPFAPEIAGSIRVSTDVLVRAIGLAMLFAAASIALPGLRLYRLSVAGALANR
jgi:ABC-type antimicrobial peptide transport system permease subunit